MNQQPDLKEIVTLIKQYKIIQEYSSKLLGVYAIPRENDIYVWDCCIFLHSGIWQGGIFKFYIVLNRKSVLSEPPKVQFVSDVFHPYIDTQTLTVDLKKLLPDWKESQMNIINALQYIKYMFELRTFEEKLFPNPNTYEIYQQGIVSDVFQSHVYRSVTRSQRNLNSTPKGFGLEFTDPKNPEDMEYFRNLKHDLQLD
ncbi:hypothetical protein WA158_000397 [Blastocystis sp. Blastoise]